MSHMHKSFTIDEHYLNSLPFPAIILNQDGQATIWGKSAEHLIGLSTNDITGNTTPSIHENLLRQLPVETFQAILQSEESTYIEKIQIHTSLKTEMSTALLAKPYTEQGERLILMIFMLPELMTNAVSHFSTFVDLKQ